MKMTRGQLAKQTGLSAATIRYYEEQGILPKPSRGENGYRLYTEDYLVKIKFIKDTKQLGYPLKEIQEVLQLLGDEIKPDILRERVLDKIADIDEKVNQFLAIKEALVQLLSTPEDEIYQYIESFRVKGNN
ncbi:DNA-binding transcriptional MerR regulator [Paenibacillus turicensis]|uniref:DNA-binding transcriptional MerR regulator n=1 Tax=Paenibacillus turicensis TaxID=160487 RepID=A0ABS4FTV6_9BACL|nr:MerR family transcriptional regulator [Paenibacillus turicensis]MBP1905997.1 DNA-binding transcriptional MerR regulator [Paenibacillus turicensis]